MIRRKILYMYTILLHSGSTYLFIKFKLQNQLQQEALTQGQMNAEFKTKCKIYKYEICTLARYYLVHTPQCIQLLMIYAL